MLVPNILIVLSDDHAGWCVGCAGNSEVHTPNIDHLARVGVRFTAAYAPCPVCSPSRASFWTGTMPSWHGVHDHLNGAGHPGIGEQPTLANALQVRGYRTAQIGKWHCHTSEDNHPRHGFDRWFSQWAGTNAKFGPQPFWDQQGRVDLHGFQTPPITERAIEFIREASTQNAPFLCAVGYTDTHRPFEDAPQRLVERYADATFAPVPAEELPCCHGRATLSLRRDTPEGAACLRRYCASVTFIDEQLGRLLDELTSLGLTENTLVIYTSDHGQCIGHHGVLGKGNATVPQNFFDESLTVPFVAHLPGLLEGGLECSAAVCHTDTYRTLIEIAGAEDPDDAPRPGRNWLPLVREPETPWRDHMICEYGNARMICTSTHKLIRRYPGPNGRFSDELYDRPADPRETRNLIALDTAGAVLPMLDAQLDDFFRRFGNTPRSGLRVADAPEANRKEPWRVKPEDLLARWGSPQR